MTSKLPFRSGTGAWFQLCRVFIFGKFWECFCVGGKGGEASNSQNCVEFGSQGICTLAYVSRRRQLLICMNTGGPLNPEKLPPLMRTQFLTICEWWTRDQEETCTGEVNQHWSKMERYIPQQLGFLFNILLWTIWLPLYGESNINPTILPSCGSHSPAREILNPRENARS